MYCLSAQCVADEELAADGRIGMPPERSQEQCHRADQIVLKHQCDLHQHLCVSVGFGVWTLGGEDRTA